MVGSLMHWLSQMHDCQTWQRVHRCTWKLALTNAMEPKARATSFCITTLGYMKPIWVCLSKSAVCNPSRHKQAGAWNPRKMWANFAICLCQLKCLMSTAWVVRLNLFTSGTPTSPNTSAGSCSTGRACISSQHGLRSCRLRALERVVNVVHLSRALGEVRSRLGAACRQNSVVADLRQGSSCNPQYNDVPKDLQWTILSHVLWKLF